MDISKVVGPVAVFAGMDMHDWELAVREGRGPLDESALAGV